MSTISATPHRRRSSFLATLAWVVVASAGRAPQAQPASWRRAAAGRGARSPPINAHSWTSTASRATTRGPIPPGCRSNAPAIAGIESHPDVWEKVIRKVRAGMMPPPGMPHRIPNRAARWWAGSRPVARSGRPHVARSRPAAGASPEPRRVRERHPRRAGARGRRGDAAAAGRFQLRLRQQRRRAGRFAGAARELPHCRRAGERAGAGRSRARRPRGELFRVRQDESQDRNVPGAADRHGGRPADRAHAAARRRVSVPGAAVPHQPRHDARAGVSSSSSRSAWTATRVHLASFGGNKEIADVQREPDHDGRQRGRALHGARAPQGRAAQDHGRVPAEAAGAEHPAAAELRAQLVRHHRLLGLPAHRRGDSQRSVQSDGSRAIRRAAAASSSCRPATVAEEEACARRILSDAGAPGLPRRRHGRTTPTRC